ncbi:MAG: hypothetical protein ACFB2X_05560 [Rivularia sp. (in: cyanobacteria)]
MFNAREGNPYQRLDGKEVKVSDTMNKIANPQTQDEALKELGVTIEENHHKSFFIKIIDFLCLSSYFGDRYIQKQYELKIEFSETGNAYAEPDGDRTKISDTSTEKVSIELFLDNTPPSPLKIKTSTEPFIEDGVNFFGYVSLETPSGETRRIPMTGRGTVALDGKEEGDFHAGIVTGGACACFQERIAMVVAVAAAAGASNQQIETIGNELHKLNDSYHGRADIFDYTIKAATTPQGKMQSYTQFMASRYPEEKRSPLLQSVIQTKEPNQTFYEKAKTKMSAEELGED